MEAVPLGWPLVAAGVALAAAGAIQGSTGFGFNMLAAPLLAVVHPDFVPAPMLMMAFVISLGGMIRERRSIDRSGLGWALAGRVLASAAAVACLGLLAPESFGTLFGVLVLLAVVLSVAGIRVKATSRNLFLAGGLSGFMGTLTSIGAPPMAIVYQNSRGPVMRATLNAFFVAGAAISLVALGWAGRIEVADAVLAGVMLPFAAAGFLLSGWGRRLVDKGRVRIVVLTVSTLSAVILIGRALA
jgi:hypothetical protein